MRVDIPYISRREEGEREEEEGRDREMKKYVMLCITAV